MIEFDFVNGRQRCLCQCHPDWSWLRFDADGTNPLFSVSDVDSLFVTERQRRLLFIEWKHEGETVAPATVQLLKAISSLPNVWVLVVYGMRGAPALLRFVHPRKGMSKMEGTSRDDFQRRVQEWYAGASDRRLARWTGRPHAERSR